MKTVPYASSVCLRMNLRNGSSLFLFVLFLTLRAYSAQAQLSRFAQLSIPVGIEVDASGYIHVGHDNVSSKLITKFNSSGQVRNRTSIGNFFSFGEDIRMARIPSTGQILGILPSGDFVLMNPGNSQLYKLGNLKQIPISTAQIYDVNISRYSSVAGNILPAASQTLYGDIAVYETGRKLYVFITAITARFPFVVRLTFDNYNYTGAKVVVASSGADFTTSGSPRGIAVNKYGKVLTTLPHTRTPSSRGYDVGVTFSYNFVNQGRPRYLFDKRDLTSTGMCTDKNGNFYVATGPTGTSIVASASGPVIAFNAALTQILWVANFGGVLVNTQEVAVNPNASRAYITISNFNSVYQVDLTQLRAASEKSGDLINKLPPMLEAQAISWEKPLNETSENLAISQSELIAYNPERPYALPQALSTSNTVFTRPADKNPKGVQVSVYPNPTSDRALVELQSDVAAVYRLHLFDANGKMVWNKEYPVEETYLKAQIDLSALPSGAYRLQIVKNQEMMSRLIIKQ